MKKRKILVIPFALGSIFKDDGRGVLMTPPDGAVMRFQAGVRNISPIDDVLIVCTAGLGSKRKFGPKLNTGAVSLAEQLRRYVEIFSPQWLPKLHTAPLTWGTLGELRMAIREALRMGFVSRSQPAELIIASNFAHINWRIKLYVKLFVPKAWTVRYEIAKHDFTLRSHVIEFAKISRDIHYFWKLAQRYNRMLHYRHLRTLEQKGLIPNHDNIPPRRLRPMS